MSTDTISRVKRSKSAAMLAYNRLSRWYDWLAASERPYREKGITLLNPQPNEHILEIGCGTGSSLIALAKAVGERGHVYGLDLSPGMLDVANGRIAAAGLKDRITLTWGEATMLPYSATSLDGVFISFTLELFDTPELPLVLAEVKRVLRRNGRFCVVALSKENPGCITSLYELFHNYFPAYADCRPIFVRRLLIEHGFHVVNGRYESMFGLSVAITLANKTY